MATGSRFYLFVGALLSLPALAEEDLSIRQVPLLEAVNALANEWDVLAPFAPTEGDTPVGPNGYGGLELDLDSNQVLLFWKYGVNIPDAVLEKVEEIRGSGVALEILKSAFSLRDLRNEYRLIVAELSAHPEYDLSIHSLGPIRSGAGIALTTTKPERILASRFYVNASKRLASKSKRPPPKPIEVRYTPAPPILYSRTRDGNPFRGGSRVRDSCSTGFSVGRLFEAKRYLLTAGHCTAHTNGVSVTTGANGGGRDSAWNDLKGAVY